MAPNPNADNLFGSTLSELMALAGFSSQQKYYDFLGGERTLGVSAVYFANWQKGLALPRADKLEQLLGAISSQGDRVRLVDAYIADLFRGQSHVCELLPQ